MKRLLLIVLPLLMIVGCSKPVEDSTLINKDGLMYITDSDKPYTGEVFTNYSTGEKEYQGTYENGLLIQYSYLNKDGSIKEPVNIETLIDRGGNLFEINGQKPYTGDIFELYPNGNKKLSGSLKGGKFDGELIEYYSNGQMLIKEMYVGGVKNGSYNSWFENGQKWTEGTFKNGEWDGLQTEWYENGQIIFEKIYNNGFEIKKKEWSYWGNGQKKEEVTFKDGKKDGLQTEWYKNGQKWTEGNLILVTDNPLLILNLAKNKDERFEKVVQSVQEKLSDPDAEFFPLFKQEIVATGLLLSRYYHEFGGNIDDILVQLEQKSYEFSAKDGLWTEWYENGQMLIKEMYVEGVKNGSYNSWFENGQKESEETFKGGKQDGLWIRWNSDGVKIEEKTYKEGKRWNGRWTDNFRGSKQIKQIESYKDGKKDGLWTEWYHYHKKSNLTLSELFSEKEIDQQMKQEQTYKDGELISEKVWNEDGSVKE